MKEFAVKMRLHTGKGWYFLGSRGTMTRLRIHTVTFDKEQAAEVARILLDDNTDTLAATKVVRF